MPRARRTTTHQVVDRNRWLQVVDKADHCCQCEGQCKLVHHAHPGGRCWDTGRKGLVVAPVKPTGDPALDSATTKLIVYCRRCYDGAVRTARQNRSELQAETLFGGVA